LKERWFDIANYIIINVGVLLENQVLALVSVAGSQLLQAYLHKLPAYLDTLDDSGHLHDLCRTFREQAFLPQLLLVLEVLCPLFGAVISHGYVSCDCLPPPLDLDREMLQFAQPVFPLASNPFKLISSKYKKIACLRSKRKFGQWLV
jgi:hypothetical protein